jgi:4-hydroxy-3-polyprenylbenzoate decarboxylase
LPNKTHQLIGRGLTALAGDGRSVFHSLREYLAFLEGRQELVRVSEAVSPELEITELCHRAICRQGPALFFEKTAGYDVPAVGNVYGTEGRIVAALGLDNLSEMRELGERLKALQTPKIPDDLGSAVRGLATFGDLAHVNPLLEEHPECQQVVIEGDDVDLGRFPIQRCWPEDAAPLITFGLVITKGPHKDRLNVGIYRQQVIGRNRLIMRWLHHRGGAGDFADFCEAHPGERFPVAVAIGCDPATTLAAVAPVPDTISELQFAGLLRGSKTRIARCLTHDLRVPATAEIVLEGFIEPAERQAEGPFGDHTGYYNAVEEFPVFTVERITHRRDPVYQATYMGKPPLDEPSVLARSLNEMFIPLLQAQFPEIVDFYLPPAACSYRVAVVSIRKRYRGHARRIMMGIWSYLRQFTYTKFVIVTDDDIDIRSWDEVLWALSTRTDPARDTMIVDRTPVDYLDFASPQSGLGSKMGIDATNKWSGETDRDWGRPIRMDDEVKKRVDTIWQGLGIDR